MKRYEDVMQLVPAVFQCGFNVYFSVFNFSVFNYMLYRYG